MQILLRYVKVLLLYFCVYGLWFYDFVSLYCFSLYQDIWSTCVHPRFVLGFVVIDLYFSMWCFVDRCFFSFCPFSIVLSVFLWLHLLITLLVSSNSPPPLKGTKPKTCLNQTDFTVPSTKCLYNSNLCKLNKFFSPKLVRFRQVVLY